MSKGLTLTGYRFSVYTRAVRMALLAKGLTWKDHELDPFDPAQAGDNPHPFGRVPYLEHGGFAVYETQAILDYLDTLTPDPRLTPDTVQGAVRMRQVMGMADAYVYGPLVRQVVSQALFAPLDGQPPDREIIAGGLAEAGPVLAALDSIAAEGHVLTGQGITLADCQLWPMMDYFRAVPDGQAALSGHGALEQWVQAMATHKLAVQTAPDLKGYGT